MAWGIEQQLELAKSYMILLNEDDVFQHDTPNGETFVRDGNCLWRNYDNPNEALSTYQLAERCAEEVARAGE